ncbi:hypothetical protein BM526_15355 [Alteromonas mediterranea]|uniref:restriction endonuclease subunit S n=1 Tax=Alteromonas mediterranea TaxID=314275 RepID=UPI0009043317|nr:restriction endonuclease subunit S [Alteromonas mediterranea]APE03103.1 hypothetical protein BM526_15355 [Alteromonas mediterranea]
MSFVPIGWSVKTFGEVLSLITNGMNGKQNKEGNGIPVSRIETIADQRVDLSRVGFLAEYDEGKIDKYRLEEGDILFSHINSPIHLGKTALVPSDIVLYHGVNLLRLKCEKSIDPRFFNYYCKYLRALGEFSKNAQHAVNQSSINQKKLKAFELVAPSLEEQKRIADKLDSVLAKVEAAQARLDKIPAILKRFRQSVLAAATSGELTNDWREENDADLEWKRVQVSEIVEKIEAGKSIKCDERPPQKDEFGIIKISAVTWGVYNELESKTLFDKSVFLENRRINVGDFLISRANTIELLGMPVIVHEVTKNLMLSDKVLRLVMDDIDKSWLSFYFRSPEGRKQIENGSSGNQESMRNIGQKALMAIELKNPTKREKLEIIRRVDELFSKADSVEQQYNAAKARLDKLTQSILKKAFKGELLSSLIDSEIVKALDGDLAMQY